MERFPHFAAHPSANYGSTVFPELTANSSKASHRFAQVSMILLICISITAPAITIHPVLPWFKVEQLLLPFLVLGYFWLLLAGAARRVTWNPMILVGMLYTVSICLSVVYGADILHQPVIWRDFYEIPKLWLPVLFFSIAYEAKLNEASLCRVLYFFSITMLFVCLYACSQWFNLGFTHDLNRYFSGGVHVDGGLERYRRVYSTMGNANVLGQLLTWAIAAFTMAFLFRVGSRVRNFSILLLCLIALAMTGSRYGLITTGVALVLMFFLPFADKGRRWTQAGFLLLLLPVFAWTVSTVATKNKSTLDRLESLKNPLQTDSFRKRLDDFWVEAGADILRSPLLGYGPAKARFTGVFTDSEYMDVLKQFGATGFFVYLAYFIVPLKLLGKGLRVATHEGINVAQQFPATFLVVRLAFIMGFTALLMNIGESTFYNQLLQAFLWMWLGLGVRCARFLSIDSATSHVPVARAAPDVRSASFEPQIT